MRLAKRYRSAGATMAYLLDTHDGQFCSSAMPATVAAEIVRSAKELTTCDMEGYALRVDGELLFPEEGFEFDESEGPTGHVHLTVKGEETPKPERPWRPKKKDLLCKARSLGLKVNSRMTNAWLTTLIEDAERQGGVLDADEDGGDTAGA